LPRQFSRLRPAKHPAFVRGGEGGAVTLEPYRNEKEFKNELQKVLEDDYGVTLMGVQLDEAAINVNQYLMAFL